jgi:hypothetical protein
MELTGRQRWGEWSGIFNAKKTLTEGSTYGMKYLLKEGREGGWIQNEERARITCLTIVMFHTFLKILQTVSKFSKLTPIVILYCIVFDLSILYIAD